MQCSAGRDAAQTPKPSASSVNRHASGSNRSASHFKGGSARGSSRGSDGLKSKSSNVIDVDADSEEVNVDADAYAEGDVEAVADA